MSITVETDREGELYVEIDHPHLRGEPVTFSFGELRRLKEMAHWNAEDLTPALREAFEGIEKAPGLVAAMSEAMAPVTTKIDEAIEKMEREVKESEEMTRHAIAGKVVGVIRGQLAPVRAEVAQIEARLTALEAKLFREGIR